MATGSTACGRSFPRRSTAIRRTGSSCARTRATAGATRYQPMLATLDGHAPARRGLDVRAEVGRLSRDRDVSSGGEVTLTSRNGNDLTERFRDVARAAGCCDPLVRRRPRRRDLRARRERPLAVLAPAGEWRDVRARALRPARARVGAARRRAALRAAQATRGARRAERAACSSRRSSTTAHALLAAARQQELEGVVAKQLDSRYKPGRRSPEWQKLKLRQTQEVVVAGYTRGQGRRGGIRRARRRGTGRG